MIKLRRKVKLSWNEAVTISAVLQMARHRLLMVDESEMWRLDKQIQELEDLLDKKIWGEVVRY